MVGVASGVGLQEQVELGEGLGAFVSDGKLGSLV